MAAPQPANQTKQSLVQSDPISGSLGFPEGPKVNTPEAILERDLASRKPFKWSYDQEQFPDTNKSIQWAEM